MCDAAIIYAGNGIYTSLFIGVNFPDKSTCKSTHFYHKIIFVVKRGHDSSLFHIKCSTQLGLDRCILLDASKAFRGQCKHVFRLRFSPNLTGGLVARPRLLANLSHSVYPLLRTHSTCCWYVPWWAWASALFACALSLVSEASAAVL